mgnify:FL=1|tara:strand:+ start:572 stop:1012 length:441 start_codon:yes stop_codon:yes gene_type:complete
MTKPRPLKLGSGNHWKSDEDERLRTVMRVSNGAPPGKGGHPNFWVKIAEKMGLAATSSAARRVRRRWAILEPNASNARQFADLQLEHAQAVCGAEASARDVLDVLAPLLDDHNVSTFIEHALSASRGADVDALEELVAVKATEDAI